MGYTQDNKRIPPQALTKLTVLSFISGIFISTLFSSKPMQRKIRHSKKSKSIWVSNNDSVEYGRFTTSETRGEYF